ncbi:MAG TPA: HEAT repeat domain-containing protein [Candidatus Paceibacterota bacterium]|nr:HEAT repeat domain-containing protein [Verrucomicrobiota bacterium]HSA10139.1 HEAT repeat domain-containing protein [Candidatus Paceibacterota bacterium]
METQRLAEAEAAVRAIGARKALPTLVSLVKTRDTPIRAWTIEKAERYRLGFPGLRSALDCQLQGIAGFEVLGTNCAAAVGELTKLLDDKELDFVAVRCLDSIGKAAEGALLQCLTNKNWQVRQRSVAALASATDDVEVYVNRIRPLLNDVEPGVRFATVEAIGYQTEAPELAVPLLTSVLHDSDDGVASRAAGGLSGFGTNALSAFSTLTNLVIAGRDGQCRAALKALAVISPVRALPILSNAVVNGRPPTMGTALKELKSIAPELALKMTLAELRSADAGRRPIALNVAGTYAVETPGIAEALKFAATDPDPEIARQALRTMRQMLQKQREKAGLNVRIPNEPVYQGKTLGEWLAMRKEGWELSTNALTALRQMGTNVVPALLARLTYKDPVFNLDDYEVSMEAATALMVLGDQAKPALPTLAALIDRENRDVALRAMIATLGAGADAIPCLMKGLTNRFADVRGEAAHFLTEWGAQFPEQRKQAIPYVARLLNDPDEHVRMGATNDLKELDPQAAAHAGIKWDRLPR